LVFLEALESSWRAVFAEEDVVHHERNQLSQLVADAGLVVPSVANGAQKLSNVQVSVFAAAEKKYFRSIKTI